MAKRTPAEVYAALVAAGWPPAQAVTMTAIAGAESSYRDDALGDVSLQTSTWGPSYGLFQIRTLKRDTGTGTSRDLRALTGDLIRQARAAWEISKHGTDFSPWTVYRTGRYEDFLGQARSAAGQPVTPAGGGTDGPFPTLGPSWAPWNWPSNAGNAVAGQALSGARSIALEAAAVGLGLALIGAGLARAVAPRIKRKAGQAVQLAKAVT